MKRHYIDISVLAHELAPADLESEFESLADAVYDLTGVIDADLGRGLLEFSMAVDSESSPETLRIALNAARTALHQAGASTAGWEQYFEVIEETIRVAPTGPEDTDRPGRLTVA